MAIVEQAPQLQHLAVKSFGVGILNEDEGIVEAYVSGIGNKDHVDDIIEPGAFVESLKVRKPKGVWAHNWDRPVSKTLEIFEVAAGDPRLPLRMKEAGVGGLYVKTQFNLETQDGRDAFSWVKFFEDEGEWSIGYQVSDSSWDSKAKANRLKAIDLYEYSPVLFGANSLTATVGVKVDQLKNGDIKVNFEGVDEEMAKKIAEAIDSVVDAEKSDEEVEVITADVKDVEDPIEELETKVEEVEEVEPEIEEEEELETKDDQEALEQEDLLPEISPVVEWTKNAMSGTNLSLYEARLLKSFIEGLIVDEKVIPGSYEDIRHKIEKALDDEYEHFYVYIHSVFDSKVVYCMYRSGERKCYQASYSITDDGVTLSDITEIDIIEVVVAKNALIEAAYKGHGPAVKALLRPLVDAASSEPLLDDEYTKTLSAALEEKAGATLSIATKKKLSDALDMIAKGAEGIGALLDDDQETKTEEVEENQEISEDLETKDDEANSEAAEKDIVEIDLCDFEEFQSLISAVQGQ